MHNKPLAIAMILPYDPNSTGGVQEYVYFISRALGALGHRVDVFGPEGKRLLPYESYVESTRLVSAPSVYGNMSYVSFPRDLTKPLSTYVQPSRYDICHIQDPYAPFAAWELMLNTKVPIVGTMNCSWDSTSPLQNWQYVMSLGRDMFSSHIHGVIAVSDVVQKCWAPLIHPRIPVWKIPCGVDPDICALPKHTRGRKRHVLFVGRLVKRKGIYDVLQALQLVQKEIPDIHCDIVGDGQERLEAEHVVRSKGLSNIVTFHGTVIGKAKVRMFGNADIFVAPYVDEALGITSLEAMCARVPVLGYQSEAFSEIFSTYPDCQLLVKPYDIPALARAMIRLLKTPKIYSHVQSWMSREAPKYSWDVCAKRHEEVYREVIKNLKK